MGREDPGSAGGRPGARLAGGGKLRLLIGVGGPVLALDLLTKHWAVENLPFHESVPVLGNVVRLTYTHNFGAAFGIHVGEYSRIFFLTLSLIALGVLGYLYVHTPAGRKLRLTAVSLVCAGAVGNLVDRIRYERGVVDFLDVGVGAYRWPVFNVADTAVSVGAVLLLVSFYFFEEMDHRERRPPRTSQEPEEASRERERYEPRGTGG